MKNDISIVNEEYKKGILSLVILNIVGACMGIFARILGNELLLFQQVAFRLFAALIMMNVLFYRNIDYQKIKRISARDWLFIVIRSIFMYLLGITLGTIAFIDGKYGNISFIMAFPMTAVLGIIILKEKINLKQGLLVFLSFVGVALISVNDPSNIFLWDRSSILAFAGTTFIALSHILRKYHTNLLNDKEITALMLFISTLLVFLTSFIIGEDISNINWNTNLVIVIVFAGLFNGIFVLMANYGFSRVDSILANNILATQSIFGLAIGVILYREMIGVKEIVGGTLIISSIILFNAVSQKVIND